MDDKIACECLYVGPKVTCKGTALKIDGFGYYASKCEKELSSGDTVYFRHDCECDKDIGPYCSVACGWTLCFTCEHFVCNRCQRYSANSCIHCASESEEIKLEKTLKNIQIQISTLREIEKVTKNDLALLKRKQSFIQTKTKKQRISLCK